jgi:hypothetical protein
MSGGQLPHHQPLLRKVEKKSYFRWISFLFFSLIIMVDEEEELVHP